MQLNSFAPRVKNRKPEPVGRGGKRGKTSGRGNKGQSSRAGHKIRPEARDFIKKLPKLRGHGKNRSRSVRTNRVAVSVVNLSALGAAYKAGETVSPESLLAKGLVRRAKGRAPFVKILGPSARSSLRLSESKTDGLTKALIVNGCAISAAAREALLAAGGTYHA